MILRHPLACRTSADAGDVRLLEVRRAIRVGVAAVRSGLFDCIGGASLR
jgi:hypothetical protein